MTWALHHDFPDLAGLLFWHALAGNQRFLPLSLYTGSLASTPPRQVLPQVWKVKRERQVRTTPVWPLPLLLFPGFQELLKTWLYHSCLSVTELTEAGNLSLPSGPSTALPPPPIHKDGRQCTRIPVTKSACIWVHVLLFHSCWDWSPSSVAN